MFSCRPSRWCARAEARGSLQAAEQVSRRHDVVRIEALGESCEPRLEDRPGGRGPSLRLVEARKAGGRAQLPGEGALVVRPLERFPEVVLRIALRADLQRELAPYPERLGQAPALLRPLDTG